MALIINTIGCIQALFLGSLLLLNKASKNPSSLIAGLLLCLFGLFMLNSIRILSWGPDYYIQFEILSNFALLLIGPLLYIYTRIEAFEYTFKQRDWLHFIPFFVLLGIYLLAKLLTPPNSQLLIGIEILGGLFLLASLSLYLAYCLYKSYSTENKLKKTFLTALTGFSLVWFINILIQSSVFFVTDFKEEWQIAATLLLSFLVVVLSYQTWFELLFRHKRPRNKLKLKEEEVSEYLLEIEAKLIGEKSYYQADYSLSELSRATKIPQSYLSKLINTEFGMSFPRYLALLRVQEFVRLAQENKHANLTLMGLANKVGFRSSSTFNKAFKEHMNMLPSAFMNSLKQA